MNGLVVIDKPAGPTSHDVVNRWRKIAGTKRVGHLGTLDPMATGVLALLTGPATRLASFFEKDEKVYRAEIRLGFVSDTYDAAGEVQPTSVATVPEAEIRSAVESLKGRFLQKPPPVSAKKIGGIPAYKLARKKIAVDLAPVEVEIRRLEILALSPDKLEIEVTCSAGTYIRSLAHDLGQKLGCGAILSSLRRTRAGNFSICQAHTLEELAKLAEANRLAEALIPAADLLAHLPSERVSESVETQIRQGRQFRTSPFVVPPGAPLVRALSRSGELVAIGKLVIPNLYQPSTVFQPE
ncbi:MAG TPA: tRNA pseudouridine(55) synthase TruB [Bryobacteraceae bacterium]|jgi:tRNA pseudouridine55 synthase|nr:tRNA pseudouridine(55) synthase TruB [Bryobacteraceae bacterium]